MHGHLQFCFDLFFPALLDAGGEKGVGVLWHHFPIPWETNPLGRLYFPIFWLKSIQQREKYWGGNGVLGLCCLVGSRTAPALGCAGMQGQCLRGRPGPTYLWGPLGGDVLSCPPPRSPPKPQLPTHGIGAERCQSCRSSQSHREEGSGLLRQPALVPRHCSHGASGSRSTQTLKRPRLERSRGPS